MMEAVTPAGAARAGGNRVTLGDRTFTIEPPSARKASRVLALVRALSRQVPDVQKRAAAFRREYEEENALELSRTEARLRFPPRPLLDAEGRPILEPAELTDPETGEARPNPRAGSLVMAPSVVDSMTEADWTESGNVLKLKQSPTTVELVLALMDEALEHSEDTVYRLLALFLMPNAEVKLKRRDGTLDAALEELVDDVLDDAGADEVLELAVIAGEVVDEQFRSRVEAIGGERLGNALRLVGMKWTPTSSTPDPSPSTDGPSSSRRSTSTDTPGPTAGDPTQSSTSASSSSSSSPDSSSSTPPRTSSPTPSDEPAETEAPEA